MPDENLKPLVSVVIVNYNGKKFLQDCLGSLKKQTYSPSEVILVDNASCDGSVELIRKYFPCVKICVQESNLGFAGGSNAGIREAHGQFILTLNNDTIAFPEFIEELVQPMISDSSVGMCCSKMVFPDGRINSTGICISRSGAAWDRGGGEPDRGQYDTAEEVFGPCAGAALYRRTMLDEIGLFDEDFFLFMEDVDLAFRARLAGWKCMYVPKARVVHIHGGTATVGSETAVYYGNRNTVWVVVKNFPSFSLLLSFPWILGRNCGIIPYYFLSGNGFTIMRAKIDGIKGLSLMIRKRRYIHKNNHGKTIEKWIQTWSGFHKS
ncbi:MAG: glycosyltransferase family 2 protein [Methanospirillum sp.]|nr:glycosyltransferase family 2 protein [Methanospirillum sp.]